MNLLGTVAKALGNSRRVDMMASLDHSMWFYEPFDFNKPMVFFMQCQVSSQGRGLAMGRFYSEDGTLLAVVVSWTAFVSNASPLLIPVMLLPSCQSQEGLVRAHDKGEGNSKASKL